MIHYLEALNCPKVFLMIIFSAFLFFATFISASAEEYINGKTADVLQQERTVEKLNDIEKDIEGLKTFPWWQTIICAAIAGILTALVLSLNKIIRWVFRSRRIRKILKMHQCYRLFYNPEAKKNKIITFDSDGQIGGDSNENENRWRVRRGKLEIIAMDGKWYSRFVFNATNGQFQNTNEPGTRSIPGQYIIPQRQAQKNVEPNQ